MSHFGTNSPRGLAGRMSAADLEKRVACLLAASVDELVRKDRGWGYLARDGARDPSFDSRTITALLKAGLLEPVGMRDDKGREVRVRVSMFGRRELARRARASGGGA